MKVFDEKSLGASLRKLEEWKRVAFMAQIAERMLPNYQRFSAETDFGDISVLRRALDATWRWVESGRTVEGLSELLESCEQQAPDTELFRSRYTSAALDAANAAAAILDALSNPKEINAVEVASLARDSIDLFVQELMDLDPNSPGFEEKIVRHDLMQRELLHQQQDLDALSVWTGDRESLVRTFRAKAVTASLASSC
jgi:hypothetical protein